MLKAVATLLILSCLASAGTKGRPKASEPSIDIAYENPYMYSVGVITAAVIVGQHRKITVIRVAPMYNFFLYTEEIAFCGDVGEVFYGTGKKISVITYNRVAHEAFEGVGCHTLKAVDEVKAGSNEFLPEISN